LRLGPYLPTPMRQQNTSVTMNSQTRTVLMDIWYTPVQVVVVLTA
jgi:hypothetical protein